jgi:hypothetical protein
MSERTVVYVKDITARFPSLATLLEEHVHDNLGELLPHVFFGDLTRYILALLMTVNSGGGLEPRRELREMLSFLEESFSSGHPELQELIGTSFLENLPRTGEDGSEIRSMLGSTLSAELRRMG